MLTQRQVRLLMLLVASDGWVTAADLSERLSVSDKLVKQEISALRAQLGATAAIESNPRRGYRLDELDEDVRARLAEDFDAHAGHHSIHRRYAQVLLMLLMADGPLSMSTIARRLYISKATVAEQVETLRYRIGRLENLELRVSRTAGVSIEAVEAERRYEASKWIGRDRLDAMGLEGKAAESFWEKRERYRASIGSLFAPQLEAGRISGEDADRIASWCALSNTRTREGHVITEPVEMPGDREAQELARQMGSQAGLKLSDVDLPALARLIHELLVPGEPSALARTHATQLLGEVRLAVGTLCMADASGARERLALRIEGIMRRTAAGHNILNWHASETVARYPFESYMAVLYLDRMLEHHVPKAESMLLALGIAGVLEYSRGGAPVILYTDENVAVIGHIRAQLKAHWGERLRISQVFPLDWSSPAPTGSIELATDPTAIVRHPRAIVLPALPSDEDVFRADRTLSRRRAEAQHDLAERLVRVVPSRSSLPQHAVLLTAYRTICAVVEGEGDVPSSVEVAPLDPPVVFRGKSYRRLVAATWNRGDVTALDYFAVVSSLLLGELDDAR